MKQFLSLYLFILLITITAQVRFDTLNTTIVGTGITHYEVFEATNPWTINVLEIDLTNPYNNIETVKANDNLLGYETVAQMTQRKNFAGHTVVGAINGDFYSSGGTPIGKQIVDGEIVKQNSKYASFGISKNKKVSIGFNNFSGFLELKNKTHPINNVNTARNTDHLILYNSFYGSSTGANDFGTEVSISPITEWIVNDTVYCVVNEIRNNQGDMAIINGGAVLSGHGLASQFLIDNVFLGDTIKLILNFSSSVPHLTQMVGGLPQIIKNGQDYVIEGYNGSVSQSLTYDRHPRTAVGFSQDSTKLYFITVDGRGYSVGMTLKELAEYMIKSDIYTGINLDGGGSTTMQVRDRIVNVPSDGIERLVANSMLVYSTAPITDTLSIVALAPSYLRIFKGEQKRFSVNGFDKYYNPISIDQSKVTYSSSPHIGIIDQTGLFVAANNAEDGFIIADYEGIKDTCYIHIKSLGKIELLPKQIETNTINKVQFRQSSWDEDGVPKSLNNSEFTWSVSDTNLASINNDGLLLGKNEGSINVFLQYEYLFDTANVRVSLLEGTSLLHSFDNTDNISLVGENLNLANSYLEIISDPKTEGSASLKIVYEYTGDPSKIYNIHLATNIPIEGVPDSIKADLKTNGGKHQLIYLFTDDNDEQFQINVKKWAVVSDYLDVQPGSFENTATTEVGSYFNFPATLTGILIKLNTAREDGIVYKDSLIIDNLRISYPNILTAIEESQVVPDKFKLFQNFPNPFNPTTTIKYSISSSAWLHSIQNFKKQANVAIKVYDVLGREVVTLVDTVKGPGSYEVIFNASNFPSGVYFYQLQTGEFITTKKMLILK